MKNINEFKKKVHEEFEKEHGGFFSSSDQPDKEAIKAFYDKRFDNLLVEVEKNCVPEENKDKAQLNTIVGYIAGWNAFRGATLEALKTFRGHQKPNT